MKKIKNIIYDILSSFILPLLTYITFIKMDIIISYNILSFCFFVLLIIIYKKYLVFNDKYSKSCLIISIIFSILIIMGRNFYAYYNVYNVDIWKEIFTIKNIIYLFGLIPLFYIIIRTIMKQLLSFTNKAKYNSKYNKIFILVSFCLMISVWTIYLLTYYPGTLSPDSISEYSMLVNGLNITSDHHPVFHVLFMALFYNIGFKIFSSPNIGVLFVSIAQMIIMASIFTYSLYFLRKRNCPKLILYTLLLLYSFSPIYGYYSITMWKDVLFGGCLLLLTIECYKIFEKKEKLQFKDLISFIIISIFTVFFRNNAIYAYIILAIILLIILKKYYKIFSISFLIVIMLFVFVKGPLFKYFDINKSSTAEYIGMPIQQIARVVIKNEKLSDNEYKKINKLIPISIIPKAYNPIVSDGIKFNSNFNIESFNNNKLAYAKLYLKIFFKHFPTVTEAYFISTLGYWYPNVIYPSILNTICENDFGIYIDSKTNETIKNILSNSESRDLPLFGMQWSIGLCVWLISILVVCFVKKNKIKGLIPFLPCITIWLTMLIASPVWGEFRYVYGLFTSLPFLIGIFFVNDSQVNNDKN
ncbi:MAG: DUF6020 family protein [Bacilli bacterium]